VLAGLLGIGFLHHQQIIWNKGRTVLTRTHYWFQHEPCWYVRKKNARWYGKPGENSTVWERTAHRWGHERGYCVVMGQKVPIERPRVQQEMEMYDTYQRRIATARAGAAKIGCPSALHRATVE
jgi:hypothetical protein